MKRIDECTNMTVLVALLVVGILLVMGAYRIFSYLCEDAALDARTFLLGAACLLLAGGGPPRTTLTGLCRPQRPHRSATVRSSSSRVATMISSTSSVRSMAHRVRISTGAPHRSVSSLSWPPMRAEDPAAGTMAEQKGRVLSWTRRILSNNFPIVTLPASWLR